MGMHRNGFIFFLLTLLITFAVTIPTSAIAQVSCFNGIISHWEFDEINGDTAVDSIGSNPGNILGAMRVPGKDGVGGALNFVPYNRVEVPNPIGFSSLNAITIEAWINLENTSGTNVIVMKGDVTFEPFFLRTQGTELFGFVRTGVAENFTHFVLILGGSLTAGTWHHVSMTYDSSAIRIYVDGTEVGNIAQSGPIFDDGENLFFGWAGTQFQNSFGYTGDIDEIAIHDRALTAEEINQHYLAGRAGCPVTTIPVGIDIKPGSNPNSINLCSNGAVPIAILGSDTFDVNDINTESLRFAEATVKVVGKKDPYSLCSYGDVNGDFILDLVCHYITADIAAIDGESTSATVNGELLDETPFEGTDSVNIVKVTCN